MVLRLAVSCKSYCSVAVHKTYAVGWDEKRFFENINLVIGAVALFWEEKLIPQFFSLLNH